MAVNYPLRDMDTLDWKARKKQAGYGYLVTFGERVKGAVKRDWAGQPRLGGLAVASRTPAPEGMDPGTEMLGRQKQPQSWSSSPQGQRQGARL